MYACMSAKGKLLTNTTSENNKINNLDKLWEINKAIKLASQYICEPYQERKAREMRIKNVQ